MSPALSQPIAPPRILWKQVLGLTALQSVIALMWLIYNLYLPQLLTQLGFPPQMGLSLLVIENAIAVIMEPLMGGLSDRSQTWMGTRFPFISIGVVLSSALFILIPVSAILGKTGMQGVAIAVIIAWAIAMTLFRSPALSLLRRYAALQDMPLATSVLSLAAGLLGTAKPLVNQAILSWGAIAPFTIASIALLGAAAALRMSTPPTAPAAQPLDSSALRLRPLGAIALVGICAGWGIRCIMSSFGKGFQALFADGGIGMGAIAIGLVVVAIPAGWLATRLGNRRTLGAGLLTTAALAGLLAAFPNRGILIGAAIILLLSLNFVFVGGVPFALSLVPAERAGLGIGLYFGGMGAAAGLFGLLVPQPERLSGATDGLLGAIAFLLAALFVWAAKPHVPPTESGS
ncbi:MAG TPA: MFS transporter [Coleofasciculaceae cyanobacterium]